MVRSGQVVENKGGLLTVVFERPEACGNCNGCLSKQCTNVELPGEAQVGDTVDVALPDKSVVKASALAYALPLALLVAGLVLGTLLHGPLGIPWSADMFALLCGGVLLIIGLLLAHGLDLRLRTKQDWQPKIVAVHAGTEARKDDKDFE